MPVPVLLLETLEELLDDDLKTLQWYLTMNILDSCTPIPRSHLEKASRRDTVSKMIERYGEEDAVNITVAILKKMNFNDTAGKLENRYTVERTATPTTSSTAAVSPAAPFTMLAQQGGVIIAPNVTNTSGSLNITFNK